MLTLPQTLYGMRVVLATETPRYTLPEELIPGVPWPDGFRDEFNAWSRWFLRTTCPVPRGSSHIIPGNTIVLHPDDYLALRLYAARSVYTEGEPC